MYVHFFKRIFDFCVSLIALTCFFPVLLVVMIWLYFANKGTGIFFTPKRPGKNGKLFKIFKFKSMTDERDENGQLLPDEMRMTPIGKFIRRTSIDELPQLINVLKGDMSFVGPRPLAARYLPYYNEEEWHRLDVRPGITGLAQINGRTALSWDHRLSYDIEYVNNLSLWLDVKILFMTIYKVIKRENVEVEMGEYLYFYQFREAQWRSEGKYDKIDEARRNAERIK